MEKSARIISNVPNAGKKPCTYVVVGPDLGLTKPQISTLKKKLKNEIVASLGGAEAMSRRPVILKIIVQTSDLSL